MHVFEQEVNVIIVSKLLLLRLCYSNVSFLKRTDIINRLKDYFIYQYKIIND